MLNTLILQARFVEDPELKHTQGGSAVTHPRIAWSEKFKDNESSLFLSCSAWGKLAEFICNYFRKGDMAVISGKLVTRTYEKDNEKRYVNELIIEKCNFCSSKKESSGGAYTQQQAHPSKSYSQEKFDMNNTMEEDEDLPF
jgi:single-strand DNA-binding protein